MDAISNISIVLINDVVNGRSVLSLVMLGLLWSNSFLLMLFATSQTSFRILALMVEETIVGYSSTVQKTVYSHLVELTNSSNFLVVRTW